MPELNEMDYVFMPRNVAVIGASPTQFYVKAMASTNMKERLFMVNPNYHEIMGRKCYASVLDIEVPLDYAILALPAKTVLSAVEDCINKGVRVIQSYTSGFSETGLEEGIRLEKRLEQMVKGKVRFLGPNCMGVYCPQSGLTFSTYSTNEEGHIGVISQSGTFAQAFINRERTWNIRISKLVSYGNAIDLDCPDFLEYLANDTQTKIIALYIEGIRDGRRLFQALKYAADRKPVFALKGGTTHQGSRVANSHTGSLAGSAETWSAMFKQAGVVQVEDINELISASKILSSLPYPEGKGVSIVTHSGGYSVVQSDMCVKAGLDVPRFSPDAVERLRRYVPVSGTMIGNPLDAWPVFHRFEDDDHSIRDVFKIIGDEEDIHSVILQFEQHRYLMRIWGEDFERNIKKVAEKIIDGLHYIRDVKGKPVMISVGIDPFLDGDREREYRLEFKRQCESEGIPVMPSLDEAVSIVAYMYRYFQINHSDIIPVVR